MSAKNNVETVESETSVQSPAQNNFGFWSMNPQFLPPAFVNADEKRMIAESMVTFAIHKVRLVNTQYGPTWWLWIDWGKGQMVLSLQDDADGTRHELFSGMRDYFDVHGVPINANMTLSILSNGNEFFNIVPPTDATEPQLDDVPF